MAKDRHYISNSFNDDGTLDNLRKIFLLVLSVIGYDIIRKFYGK